jgi:hypothetical protein
VASAQSYNRYSYARNNPLTNVDPSGFDDCYEGDAGDIDDDGPIDCGDNQNGFPSPAADPGNPQDGSPGGTSQGNQNNDVPAGTQYQNAPPLQQANVWGTSDPDAGLPDVGDLTPISYSPELQPLILPLRAFGSGLNQSQTNPCAQNPSRAAFVSQNLGDATQIAGELATPTANILGLAAYETGWGTGPQIAGNNYFNLASGPAFASGENGTMQIGGASYWTYPGPGLLASGQAFAQSSAGRRVYGTQLPATFASDLNSYNGPVPGGRYDPYNSSYAPVLASVINQVSGYLSCINPM